MIGYSFRDLARDVLQSTKKPMSAEQIWEEANSLGIAEKVGSKGKTPWRSIQAQLYTDIKDGSDSDFLQLSKHPVLFGLKSLSYGVNQVEVASDDVSDGSDKPSPTKKAPKPQWNERDLHPLLATYVRSDPHFRCYAKTIYQEKSSKKSKNADMWTHPDMVGVYFPFKDFEASTIQLQDTLRVNPYRIFSFELKKSLTTSHLREYFFQAVSNSSWANEGYLVAPSISSDSDFLDDLQRLSSAFGIGIIRLDIEHAEQSEILFQAQTHDALDWSTVDRLSSINPDFRDFLTGISNTAKIHTVSGTYDKILEGDAYDAYLKKHGMLNEPFAPWERKQV